jgi:hypothetical protein
VLGICARLLQVMNFWFVFLISRTVAGLSEVSGDSSTCEGESPKGVEPPVGVDASTPCSGVILSGVMGSENLDPGFALGGEGVGRGADNDGTSTVASVDGAGEQATKGSHTGLTYVATGFLLMLMLLFISVSELAGPPTYTEATKCRDYVEDGDFNCVAEGRVPAMGPSAMTDDRFDLHDRLGVNACFRLGVRRRLRDHHRRRIRRPPPPRGQIFDEETCTTQSHGHGAFVRPALLRLFLPRRAHGCGPHDPLDRRPF